MILASCNGLLLLRIIDSSTEGIVVANPAIKKWHMLPKPLAGPEGPYWDCLYSIVFDASSKLYKVVHLLLDLAGKLICEVITFGSPNQSWRRVNVPLPMRPGAIIDHKYNPFRIGQILFWVDGHSSMYPFNGVFNPSKHHIMSMDVVKEEFRRIKPPNFTTQICCLLDWGGKLALFNFDRIKIDAWVLQDYEGQVWMKKHSISNKRLLRYFWTHGWKIGFMLTASLHDGKVLIFNSRNKIYQYDIEYDLFAQSCMAIKVTSMFCNNKRIYYPVYSIYLGNMFFNRDVAVRIRTVLSIGKQFFSAGAKQLGS
ncbi:putative F-box protein At4g21240 [Asparagus officinalis]|uniref:putative F-box protein At4g21240 n=1 Tax=Asparagus officinalis TaxID=4686 RepID=UPI00098E60FA|nr:putative F-box protein At4g21240 [Asparagus officinalis]